MKEPTTPFQINTQKKAQITRDFLLSQGWRLMDEMPLYDYFQHAAKPNLKCIIGMYGEFNITEPHWCNNTPEKTFSTINTNLTTDDYFKILLLLNINI